MRKAAIAYVFLVLGLVAPVTVAAKPSTLTCADLMQDFARQLPGFRVSFERPLTITRDLFGNDEPGVDIHVLATDGDVDGTLRCRGDMFARLELRIAVPADAKVEANFIQFERAAVVSVLHIATGRAASIVSAMSSDADEYLRASLQRGDTYDSGKVEYHQGTSFDLGMIWTPADKTLVVTTQGD